MILDNVEGEVVPEEERLLRLVEKVLNSGRTPEEVCENDPDLLQEVKARVEMCRRLDAEIQALFPGPGGPPPETPAPPDGPRQ
jgi:hypothetical protein